MARPYDDTRILDLTHDLGRYVGRLFADLGADTLRIEPPGGLADRAALARSGAAELAAEFAFLNASKQSMVLDLASGEGWRTFLALAATAQIVILERDGPGFDRLEELRAAAPAAVVTAISPVGRVGPDAGAPASDLVLQAAGGLAWLSGRLGEAPLRLPHGQATMMTGVYAAVATAAAYADAQATGRGHLVEVSAQECIAHTLQHAVQAYDLERKVSMRGGVGTRDATENIFECKDGLVFLAAPLNLGDSWGALTRWLREVGHPSAAVFGEERWKDRKWRLSEEAKTEFREQIESFTRMHTMADLTEQALRRDAVMGPVNSPLELLDDPQLAYRRYFQPLVLPAHGSVLFPGAPYRLSEPVWALRPAPALGQHDVRMQGADHAGAVP